jgi:hypothetical protein
MTSTWTAIMTVLPANEAIARAGARAVRLVSGWLPRVRGGGGMGDRRPKSYEDFDVTFGM